MTRHLPLRGLSISALLAVAFIAVTLLPAPAQTTYRWLGDGAGGTSQSWTNAPVFWEDLTTPANPAANPPGSLVGGAATDNVIIKNTRTGATQQTETIRINDLDVGAIDTLQLGGYTNGAAVAPPAAGNWRTELQVRGDNGNIQINTLTLGAVDIDQDRAGLFRIDNLGSSATVGTVLSGSSASLNHIRVGDAATGGFTLNGDIDASGTREIDLIIGADDDVNTSRIVLGTGGQLLSVDSFQVGFGLVNTASFTLEDGNVVEANNVQVGLQNAVAGASTRDVTGTLTIDGGASVSSLGGSGQNGNVTIGNTFGISTGTTTANGTLNVEDGTLLAPNFVGLGSTTVSPAAASAVVTTDGTLNLNDANSVVTVGRISDTTSRLAGGINVGEDRSGTGEININAGTLSSLGRVNIAGDLTNGADRNTTGTVNVNAGGTLDVGNATAADLTFDGNVRAPDTTLGTANLEVGRDGQGFLNVDGGNLTLYRGNLVLGQSGADVNDDVNQPLGVPLPNTSRGTVTFGNGAQVMIGVIQGPELLVDSTPGPAVTGELLSNLSYGGGGGDITQSGATTTVTIENNLSMGGVDAGQARNSYTISDGTLTVGNDADIRASDFDVLGDGSTIIVSNNLTANAGTILSFDFMSLSTITAFDVGNDAALGGATLNLLNTSALGTYLADIPLIDLTGPGAVSGVFNNFAEGDTVGAYKLTYNFAGGGVGLVVIPEPSRLAILVLGLVLAAGRRRRCCYWSVNPDSADGFRM